ncbi:MAG: T9SS type A sorting domain-containing protein, partial [Chlorobi bacterium]|nr:T9SS type A sorting domain-containing protein [Chlorobiota bacterium]
TLYPAYPNPFNPSVTINYSVASAMDIQIKIFNLQGELITTLVNDYKPIGKYSSIWKGMDSNNHHVSSGVYFVRLTAGEFTQSQKIIFQK